MVVKRAGLAALTVVAAGMLGTATAQADTRLHLNFLPFGSAYGDYYGDPMFVPAPRYYYYYEPRPRFRPRYYTYQYEPDYYEPETNPEYLPPPRKKKRTTTLPDTNPATKQQQQKSGSISCAKATQIVTDYGFTQVQATSCKGKVYAFNARRDGKPYSIKVSPASGELTEVKKQ